MEKTLQAEAQALGISLSDQQLEQFSRFCQALLEKNQVMNLTAITQPDQVARLHFLDSIAILSRLPMGGKRLIDVGCGAGFPGVPLKIAEPSLDLTLLDSLGKRMTWLEREALPTAGVEAQCVTARAEEYVSCCREIYDFAVSRAVARLPILAELCLPYVCPGGYFLAMKGAQALEELEEARSAISKLGAKVEDVFSYEIGDAVHHVILLRKHSPTPKVYPRRYAKIKQQPL